MIKSGTRFISRGENGRTRVVRDEFPPESVLLGSSGSPFRRSGDICIEEFGVVLRWADSHCTLMLLHNSVIQLSNIFVTGSVTWSRNWRANWLTYSSSSDQELFYINDNEVVKDSFCKALEYWYETGCFVDSSLEEWGRAGRKYCGLKISLGTNKSVIHQSNQKNNQRKENHDESSLLAPKTMAMAVAGAFLLCCGLICPCFRPKRKGTAEVVLTKDRSSMDSISSLEASSASENLPGSPHRVPASPHRVPANPHRVPPSPSRFSISPKLSGIGSIHLNMSQVIKATQNFSPLLQIGEGGFGTVYRAQLQDGQVVAIKRAKKENFNDLQAEFRSEVEMLSKIEHRSLVRLLGYVDKGNERILITEFVPNGTLREHLDGHRGKILDFYQRLEISIDVAHALAYLHLYAEKQIIHRDVKSSNILLTDNMRAKVADFGFARAGPTDVDQTHISTKVKGTAGYLDPEYLRTYQLTAKSDVFSFGILLIEILTARRPVELKRAADERVTIRWAFKNYNEGKLVEMLDPSMNEVVHVEILSKMFALGFQCAAPTRSDRPNMKEVGEQLWAIRMDYLKSVKRGG
ncbi:Protein kinase domain [Macleaya cordata]|uniref:non-specific serine/threonine protein kinase n=1 Tax=Macleaya cordata TaxID=56857 RepID=A0A200Q041_MACCD|nr:Protein kinase domain [Macleaya cordata]